MAAFKKSFESAEFAVSLPGEVAGLAAEAGSVKIIYSP
jgi:hypothetical protein